MSQSYRAFFEQATGHRAYPYQSRLAEGGWPDVIEVPTGLGKTASVVVAWLWKRLQQDPETPRRLVYCLPMRVLVEQTVRSARQWVESSRPAFDRRGGQVPTVWQVMGGEVQAEWAERPEQPAIIVGTQDMLLSRALMRGYGMSRFQWPVHFAFLHSDALWIYDEVQLMGPALPTSAQLDAFRRELLPARTAHSIWMSATLRRDWLATVDFKSYVDSLDIRGIGEDDRAAASERLDAPKHLARASVRLDRESAKSGARSYIDSLADAVIEAHRPGTQTLVIVNRVSRAQELYRTLAGRDEASALLLHARFRPAERSALEEALRSAAASDRIVVATQAVEAGVDISSATLFTELAPWSSMVQRFGRCNRYGEVEGGATVRWIDITEEADQAAPYEARELAEARATLDGLDSARPSELPPVASPAPLHLVLRRKDFLELFDTEPDLSGFDLDISPFIRDQGGPQIQVFWRSFGPQPDAQPTPRRVELCPVSMGQMRDYLKKTVRKTKRRFWTWDSLAERWVRAAANATPRPGSVVLLRSSEGGYAADVGFDPALTDAVDVLPLPEEGDGHDAFGQDTTTAVGRFVSLDEHTQHVRAELRRLVAELVPRDEDGDLLDRAALWHDVGKAHPAFQRALLDFWSDEEERPDGTVWAKSSGAGRLRYRIQSGDEVDERRYFRHELASMLAWLARGDGHDLVAYLIAAHHGKLRMALRALPDERPPDDDRLFARGVWEGDRLPAVELDGLQLPETPLSLEVMRLGRSEDGPSWTERTRRLLEELGPFRLAWLEALLRVADWRASSEERPPPDSSAVEDTR